MHNSHTRIIVCNHPSYYQQEDDEDNPDVEVVLDAMEKEESEENDGKAKGKESKDNDDNAKEDNGKDDDKDDDEDDDDDNDGVKVEFIPASLIPDDDDEFYRYDGSLTTPPCFESVIWTVMKETLPVSKAQVKILALYFPT